MFRNVVAQSALDVVNPLFGLFARRQADSRAKSMNVIYRQQSASCPLPLISCGERLFSKRAVAHHAMTWVQGSDVRRRRARSLPLPLGCGSFRLGS